MKRKTFILSILQAFLACLSLCCLLVPDFVNAPGILTLAFRNFFHFSSVNEIFAFIGILVSIGFTIALIYSSLKAHRLTYLVSAGVFLFAAFAFFISAQYFDRFLIGSGFERVGVLVGVISFFFSALILFFSLMDFRDSEKTEASEKQSDPR